MLFESQAQSKSEHTNQTLSTVIHEKPIKHITAIQKQISNLVHFGIDLSTFQNTEQSFNKKNLYIPNLKIL